MDWFEITLTITLNLAGMFEHVCKISKTISLIIYPNSHTFLLLAVYVKIGIFLGFFEITLFELREKFDLVILGPIKYTPDPFDPVAELDLSSGILYILESDVTCESKGGSMGQETIQCWETNSGNNPVIKTFENVKFISSPPNMVDLNCILSETDVS